MLQREGETERKRQRQREREREREGERERESREQRERESEREREREPAPRITNVSPVLNQNGVGCFSDKQIHRQRERRVRESDDQNED